MGLYVEVATLDTPQLAAGQFINLVGAIEKFNWLEEQDKRTCKTCGVTQDSYCNECEEYNKWFRVE